MLKGDVFAEQLFENQIFALFINTFLNGANGVASGYQSGLPITYSGGNVTIGSGAVCIQGRFLEESTSTTLAVGETSKYHKLVIEIDLDKTNTAENFQQAYYKILTGSSAYPTLTQTDIVNNVAGVYQYELAQFRTDGSGNVTNFEDKRTFLSITSIYTAIQSATDTLLDGIESNANTLITNLQSEIAGVEDNSDFVLKQQFMTREVSVTPTQSGGNYYVNVTTTLPGGWNDDNTIVLRIEYEEYTGVGNWYQETTGTRYGYFEDLSSNTLTINNIKVVQDTEKIRLTLMRL